ncbi:MAG: SpoIVB peptidase S55 domain-containing protein, partial [Bacillota bacterium]|nr:SpoIVB peptidase S55 domain-containing protein [Bacillota bacterium]
MRRRPYRYAALLLFFLAIFTLAHRYVEARLGLPSYLHLVEGQSEYFRVGLPVTLSVSWPEEGGKILFNHRSGRGPLSLKRREILALTPLKQGRVRVAVRLFGLIPLPERVLEVVPPVRVVPGGHSIGVLLAPQGLIVSGFSPLPGPRGRAIYPARAAGLKVGDLVTHLDGEAIYSAEQVGRLVDRCGREGRPVRIQVRRGQRFLTFRVRPVRLERKASGAPGEEGEEVYRIGVFLDDPAAGVGTLTFYEPATRIFGALGHMVANFSGREGPGLIDGRIV